MFSEARGLTSLDLSNWDTGRVRDMSGMFSRARGLTSLDLANWNTSRVRDMSDMFSHTVSLETIDLSSFDTSNVTNMSRMFSGEICFGGETIPLSEVDHLTSLDLYECPIGICEESSGLISLDLSNFDTSSVIDMSGMFMWANQLTTLDISSFDTSNVIYMDGMFFGAYRLTSLDVSNWDISNVTDMNSMFMWACSLTNLDLSNWDAGNLYGWTMDRMLYGTYSLRLLTLGKNFEFVNYHSGWWRSDAALPELEPTSEFTGYWQNVGSGTVANPIGEFVFTSEQLMEQFDGATMADTFVWQPVEREAEPTPRETLRELIAEAEARIQANYTPLSWARMQSMLVMARSVYNNPTAADAQINDAINLLRTRLDELVPR